MSQSRKPTKKQTEPLFYDNADMKRLFHISDKTLQRLRLSGQVPFVKFGNKYLYPIKFFQNLADRSFLYQ
ncbi:helix-turn-helix domain-containing protein [Cloacibacterium sp.]|jgi:hypothetical protein